MIDVLHTHNRKFDFHPHIHVLIPALAVIDNKRTIRQTGQQYLYNVKSLASFLRTKCLDAFTKRILGCRQEYVISGMSTASPQTGEKRRVNTSPDIFIVG